MNKIQIIVPSYLSKSFNCPHCKAYSAMKWDNQYYSANYFLKDCSLSTCQLCDKYSVWVGEEMIYPKKILVDDPNYDLPDDIKKDYLEAAKIISDSPRGAAALLRLATEKLIDHIKPGGESLFIKIGKLVKEEGLNEKLQKSLDVVRVVGNNAVHPGQINSKDNAEVVLKLFKIINFIADKMITEPKEIDCLFNENTSENEKESIVKRDLKK